MMPFGLKNARYTYQWMVTIIFRDKIRSTVEVYINDMVVKSKKDEMHVTNLNETFEILRQHKLRLNSNKCTLGAGVKKFLGYMITSRGIEVNPDQIKVIQQLTLPMIAALNRFVSRSANRCRPFFQLLRKWKGF